MRGETANENRDVANGLFYAAFTMACAGACCLTIDLPVAAWARDPAGYAGLPGDLRRLVHYSECFAHLLGVALFLAAAWLLDPKGRLRWGRLACISVVGGLIAMLGKGLIHRARPSPAVAADVWSTFEGWFPLWQAGHAGQSFPSGHAAAAAALAAGLGWRYPRGRWLFLGLAALAGFQRIAAGAHYPSDVLFGAAIGTAFAASCLHPTLFGRWFDSAEQSPALAVEPEPPELRGAAQSVAASAEARPRKERQIVATSGAQR